MYWSTVLSTGMALEGGRVGELNARGGGGAKHLGEGRIRTCRIHELAHRIRFLFMFVFPSFFAAVYNVVPPPNVTAKKLINNFLLSTDAVNTQAPTQNTKEDLTKDIVVVLDSSGSIVSDEFSKGKTALKNMMVLEREKGNDTKYAAVTFSDVAFVNFSFLPYAEAENEILSIPYRTGRTNTQAGLAEAKKLFDDLSTGRYSDP